MWPSFEDVSSWSRGLPTLKFWLSTPTPQVFSRNFCGRTVASFTGSPCFAGSLQQHLMYFIVYSLPAEFLPAWSHLIFLTVGRKEGSFWFPFHKCINKNQVSRWKVAEFWCRAHLGYVLLVRIQKIKCILHIIRESSLAVLFLCLG